MPLSPVDMQWQLIFLILKKGGPDPLELPSGSAYGINTRGFTSLGPVVRRMQQRSLGFVNGEMIANTRPWKG